MYFKVLNKDGGACHGGHGKWNLPRKKKDGTWIPGKWMPVIKGKLIPCKNGYHLCREKDLLGWLYESIYEAEYRGEMIEGKDKIVVREARLLRRMNWDERIARLFACDCAETVLPIFEKQYPKDDRPRKAIGVARLYVNGMATIEETSAADSAARSAADSAASSAAWSGHTMRLLQYLEGGLDV
jgi:hypothetical protein